MRIVLGALIVTLVLLVRRAFVWQRVVQARERAHPIQPNGEVADAGSLVLDGGPNGVLIVHGFGDSPQSVAPVAHALHASGFTVHAPLLAGHGRTLTAFSLSRSPEWEASARSALEALQARCARVAIVGVSAGGALACQLSIEAAKRTPPQALVLITPYLEVPALVRWVTPLWPLWALVRPWIPSDREASIREPQARADSLGYGALTPRLLRELRATVERGASASSRVTLPTLAIFSTRDYRIPVAAAHRIFERIGAPEKELRWVHRSGHVVTVDYDRDEVAAWTVEWIASHLAAVSA